MKFDTLRPQMIFSRSDMNGNNQQFNFGYNLPTPYQWDTFFNFTTTHTGNVCATNDTSMHTLGWINANPITPPWLSPASLNNWMCMAFRYSPIAYPNKGWDVVDSLEGVSTHPFNYLSHKLDTCRGILKIGIWKNANPLWFKGKIDEIRIYNRHIGQQELYVGWDKPFCTINPTVMINLPFAGMNFCVDSAKVFQLPYTSNNSFGSGNVFTAQLSNSSGSFASPITLGSVTATASGVINCVIPLSVTPGSGYKIRIVSSSPASISNEVAGGVNIYTKPVVTAGSNTPVCAGSSLNLTSSSTVSGVTYSWTSTTGFSSAQQNPVITNTTATSAGSYYVIANNNGCKSLPDTEVVVVNPSPGTLTKGSNSPICSGNALNLSASSTTAGVSYSWAGPSSYSSTQQNPVIANAATTNSGIYTVTATIGSCSKVDTIHTTVNQTPTVNASSNAPLCTGSPSLNLSATASPSSSTYSWIGPVSYSSSSQNPSISTPLTTHSGDYIVTAILGQCSSKDTVTVNIYQTPVVTASSNTPVCAGGNLNLTSSGSPSNVTYTWTGPVSFGSTQQNPVINSVNIGHAGTYTVIAANNICADTATTVVNVLAQQSTVGIYPMPNDSICAGSNVSFAAVITNSGPNVQYKWYKNGVQAPGITTAYYAPSGIVDGDEVYFIAIPDNNCPIPIVSDTSKIAVMPWLPASVSISASPYLELSPWQMVTFTATPLNGGNNPTYQWKRNSANVSGATSAVWGANNLANGDTVWVTMKSSYICPQPAEAISNKLTIKIKTGIEDIGKHSGISIYPNPNNGSFIFASKEQGRLALYNMQGQQLGDQRIMEEQTVVTMPSSLPAGIYYARFITEAGVSTVIKLEYRP